ncbi:MAG: ATP-dependent DNA helicase RecQ [Spirochaetia bacterium]|nr:ATP-dependent DNA helicase RecQ [Spirochaetia bacterium]
MNLEETIDDLASHRFSVASLRPFQKLVITRILEHDTKISDHQGVVVVLPTGGGKSLCFMLSSLLVEGLTVLVYPLLSLMNDQERRLEAANIKNISIRGGQSTQERNNLFAKLDSKEVKVVITNAECLLQSQVINRLRCYTISLFVLDEAHTIVSWGEGFRPALASLGTVLSHLRIRQILCFTATADRQIITGLNRIIFTGGKPHYIRGNSDRPNISYHVVRTLNKEHTLSTLLKNKTLRPSLIFCTRRDRCESATRSLLFSQPDLTVRYYHAGLSNTVRKSLESWFASDPEAVLFATKAFGMGIDVSHIASVIHFDLSEDVLSFLQESGRAGRDGRQAYSIVLLDGEEKESSLQRIFTNNQSCFRNALLSALGEENTQCSGCDICNQNWMTEREGERVILEAIAHRPFHHSCHTLADLLIDTGKKDAFSGFLHTWQENQVRQAITILLSEGKIKKIHTHLYLSLGMSVELLTTNLSSSMLSVCKRRINPKGNH